jgi:hypothetical protein
MKWINACVCLWFVCACADRSSECLDSKAGCKLKADPTLKSDAGDPTPERLDAAAPPGDTGTPMQPSMTVPTDSPDAAPPSVPPQQPADADDDGGATSPPKPGGPVAGPIDKVDLLFVVDNTNSMRSEQASLKAAFPKLIDALTQGVVSNGQPTKFRGIRDLHVGVVSTDMGVSGAELSNCHADGGDDGRLQHLGREAGCATDYPSFLAYDAGVNRDFAQFASDFACIAALGTGGCGFEQSLEAPLKALWPSKFTDQNGNVVTPNPITFLSTTSEGKLGRGDLPAAEGGSLGFLRNDPSQGRSLIAIVVVTDEDDCSVRDSMILWPNSRLETNSPYFKEDINLRCHDNPTALYDVDRYVTGFRKLREGEPTRVVFAAITGVPTDLVQPAELSAIDFGSAAASDAFYEKVLRDPRMQETIDLSTNPGMGTGNLTPSCDRLSAAGEKNTAAPPRRIVQLAQRFGAQGIVQSICQDDLTAATDTIVALIGRQIAASHP